MIATGIGQSVNVTLGVSGLFIAAFVAARYLQTQPQSAPPSSSSPMVQYEPGKELWAGGEKIAASVRDNARQEALKTLYGAWSALCPKRGSKPSYGGLEYYLEQRGMQERSYALAYGEAGHRYIAEVFSSSDDQRIERLLQQVYGAGYFHPDLLAPNKRELARRMLGDERPGVDACPQ